MTDQSSAELERDAELARARVADTAESIRSKMSPGQLIDEFSGLFSGGDGSAALSNLKRQIRDNPLPLTLVGAGLAWLMLGSGGAPSQPAASKRLGQDADSYAFGNPPDDEANEDGVFDKLRHVAGDVAEYASSIASDAVEGVGSKASETMRSATSAGKDWTASGSRLAGNGRQTVEDLVQREPLIIAALGVAVGAAIGALLPSTEFEQEQFGAYAAKVRDTVDQTVRKGVEGAKDVAAETYETLKAEADDAVHDDAPIVQKVANVVKSTAEQTEDAVREKLKKSRK